MREKICWLILETIVGAALIGIGSVTQIDYYSAMVFAMGCGLSFGAIVQIIRILYWQSPKHLDEYEARKRNAHIDSVDERKQYLRMRAGHLTLQIMIVTLLLLDFLLSLLRVEVWVIGMIFMLFVMCWIVWDVTCKVLEKRM